MTRFARHLAPDRPHAPFSLAVIVAVVLADQLTKIAADAWLPVGEAVPFLPILSFYRATNTGIALSLFADTGTLLIFVMLAVMAIIIVMWVRSADGGRWAAIGFALILGGAIGNLIDRLRLGHVIDFLFLHIGTRPLFVFNVADVALTLGPALLVVLYLMPERAPKDD